MTTRTPEQLFYDRNGFYERQDYNPKHEATYLAWSHDFDNRQRHCWSGKDGSRRLDNRAPEYDPELGFDQPCTVDHDPKLSGNIEWLRFIHEFGAIAPEGQRYFTEDGQLWINPVGLPMSDGRRMYAEAYFNRRPTDESLIPGFSFRLKFCLFLANGQQFARMECYDESLYDLCQKALAAVEASYEQVPA